jgi:cytochrome b6-f complex iron-sulfur subunit
VVTDRSRRSFLRRVWKFLGLLALAEALWLVASFLRPRRGRHGADGVEGGDGGRGTVTAGRIADFLPGSVTAFPGGRFYLARLDDGGFLALSRTCTHLGCTVPWVAEEGKFVCPCHASAFDIRGEVVNPPAPRALDLYTVRIEGEFVKVDLGESTQRKRFDTSQVVHAP